MLYQNFNQYIKTKFFPPGKRGETILFSVDETIITEFLNKENITGKTFQRTIAYELKDWSITRANENYFGLCAIQIFMVSQMQDDVEYSAREYNPRLADFLRIDTNTLQKLYADNQDTIWEKLKQYAGENDYRINIPGQSSGKGRYIQYPFSQALLNKEDLRKTSILFQRIGVTPSEYIPFEDFALLIKATERESGMPGRYNKIKNKLLNDRGDTMPLYQQIYDYFINE